MPGDPTADVSVVVVNWNSGDDLIRCVRSVFESAGEARVELIVVDNHSRDGSADRAVEACPEIRLIRNATNRGFGAASNQGMRAGTAPWVFLLNPDARVTGGTFGGLLKVAAGRPRAGAIGVLTRTEDGSIYASARKVPSYAEATGHALVSPFAPDNPWSRAYTMAGWDRATERRVDWVSGSSVLLRRETLNQVGLFDESYFMYVEDLDLCTRMRAAGWEVWFSPEMEVVHEVGSVTRGKRRMTMEHSKSMYRYFVKHRSPGAQAALRPAAWLVLMARAELVSWRRKER
jgi:N-acetylglucosaminyl-diphospho-decaprenol L-rhamnosyltransferase